MSTFLAHYEVLRFLLVNPHTIWSLTLQRKGHVPEVSSVTRLVEIVKNYPLQPLLLVVDVLEEIVMEIFYN